MKSEKKQNKTKKLAISCDAKEGRLGLCDDNFFLCVCDE